MLRIIAVGSPKGGVGKTTTAVTLAGVAVRQGLSVLLVDGDSNRSALDWAGDASDDVLPIDVTDGKNADELAQLRAANAFDLVLIDLPGARAGAFETVLTGGDQESGPLADLLVTPVAPEYLDLRPVLRVVRAEVLPLGLPTLLVFTRVPTAALPRARERQVELRAAGLSVAETIVRRYSIYDEAVERSCTVLDLPGQHSYARAAEADYRALMTEVLAAAGTNPKEATRG